MPSVGKFNGIAWLAPAAVVVAALAGLGPVIAFALGKGGGIAFDDYVWRIVGFTLWQATLSTLLSVGLALPAARALAFRNFPGRGLLTATFAVPQAMPAIVVVLALVELYGQAGWFGGFFSLYGLSGILLAHVFFNLPLAIRIFLEALEQVRPENLRLAAQLGFGVRARFRHVEWPALRPVLARTAALIFLLCAASFVVVLTLGGPAATTLEVAIYQSLRLDFDVTRAVTLSLLQVLLCLVLVYLAGRAAAPHPTIATVRLVARQVRPPGPLSLLAVAFAALIVIPPLVALVGSGAGQINFRPALVSATMTSFAVALASAALALCLAWPIATLQTRRQKLTAMLTAVSLLGLIVPPAVMATGWFLLLRNVAGWSSSLALISALNSLMALPFSLNILASAMAAVVPPHDRLCAQLGISGWTRFWRIDAPALKRPLAQAFLLAFVLSFGDLTAITLIGTQGITTLPSLAASEMGQYRSANAEGTALLLAIICLAATLAANRIGDRRAQA